MFKFTFFKKNKVSHKEYLKNSIDNQIMDIIKELNERYLKDTQLITKNNIRYIHISSKKIIIKTMENIQHIFEYDNNQEFLNIYKNLRKNMCRYFRINESVLVNPVIEYSFKSNEHKNITVVLLDKLYIDSSSDEIHLIYKKK